jgi:hypothetical protein
VSAEDPVRLVRAGDGSSWRIGTDADVAWIAAGTSVSRTITAAIPPVFEAYATIVLPGGGKAQDKHDQAVLALLSERSPGQPWWLGYLDTGADDIVFPDAPMVTLYPGWHYVLVEARTLALRPGSLGRQEPGPAAFSWSPWSSGYPLRAAGRAP